jgi:hypothetical protein
MVKKKRNGKWVLLKRHLTRKKALAHLRALYTNVKEAQ